MTTEFNAVREALSNHIEYNDDLDHEMASRLLVVLDTLGKEALINKAACSPSSPVVAEAVPWVYRRESRCPHGVSPLNRCERCD